MIDSPLLITSAILFFCGLVTLLTKKNIVFLLIGLELMLNAANLNFVYFSKFDSNPSQGQFYAILIILVAAAEIGLGLAIALKVRENFGTVNPDELKS